MAYLGVTIQDIKQKHSNSAFKLFQLLATVYHSIDEMIFETCSLFWSLVFGVQVEGFTFTTFSMTYWLLTPR